MILVFVFLGIIIISLLVFFILVFSNVKIKIDDLDIYNLKLNKNYKLFIQLYFLNKIKLLSIKIDNKRINKIKLNEKFKNMKNFNYNLNIDKTQIFRCLKIIRPKIEKLNLEIDIGTEEAYVTSYLVALTAGIISTVLPYFAENSKTIKYLIVPLYNKNILNINLTSIINLKIVHIIYIMYILVKKGSNKNGRTSNRRAYANSYE